ncbi:hypothetical protein C0J52_24507 [Blattella germanica]|nr:hypothetical protein C0J52_24507 [Blattella germanica]
MSCFLDDKAAKMTKLTEISKESVKAFSLPRLSQQCLKRYSKERTSWHELLQGKSLGFIATFNQNSNNPPWIGNIPLPQQNKKYKMIP